MPKVYNCQIWLKSGGGSEETDAKPNKRPFQGRLIISTTSVAVSEKSMRTLRPGLGRILSKVFEYEYEYFSFP